MNPQNPSDADAICDAAFVATSEGPLPMCTDPAYQLVAVADGGYTCCTTPLLAYRAQGERCNVGHVKEVYHMRFLAYFVPGLLIVFAFLYFASCARGGESRRISHLFLVPTAGCHIGTSSAQELLVARTRSFGWPPTLQLSSTRGLSRLRSGWLRSGWV